MPVMDDIDSNIPIILRERRKIFVGCPCTFWYIFFGPLQDNRREILIVTFFGELTRFPKVQPLTLLYTVFHRKSPPFVYLLLTNGTTFTNLVQNFASLLAAVNALSKPEIFLVFFTAIKSAC